MDTTTVVDTTVPHLNTPTFDVFPALESIFHGLATSYPHLVTILYKTMGILMGLSIPVSLFFLIVIVYCVEQLKIIRKKEAQIYDLKVVPAYETVAAGDSALTHRWESVKRHIESQNQNDWKQAILEADVILDNVLTVMGYKGESVGEKLKRVEKGDFKSHDDAWEAHKVRNQVAHDGSTFVLSQYEAKRVINLYKKVFEEFYYI